MREISVGKTKVLKVEQSPFLNSPDHGTYLQDPRWDHAQHTNVVEQGTHFWRKGLPLFFIPGVCYDKADKIISTHSGRKVQVSNVPRQPQKQQFLHAGF